MLYLTIKHLHMALAATSLLLFLARALGSVRESAWPHQTPWLAAKLVALVFYIGFGTLAIKRGRTPGTRAGFAVLAVLTFGYMVAVAIGK